ncbi:MAG: hypothetical protein COB38_13610 [Gammaproteobacteria bacterium]|nr:MAG: hypothetical protein COB38_13610 [Gammaproteobacteria bacterium]
MGDGSLKNKRQRRSYFLQRTILALLWVSTMFSRSVNHHFFDELYNKDEIYLFTLICFVPMIAWVFYLDKRKHALGITEFVFPKRRITIEKTNDVSENIRRYKIAEQVEIARVIEERKNSNFINRFWKRLNI